jgi:hypothetical protein
MNEVEAHKATLREREDILNRAETKRTNGSRAESTATPRERYLNIDDMLDIDIEESLKRFSSTEIRRNLNSLAISNLNPLEQNASPGAS